VVDNRVIQITWKNRQGLVYNLADLSQTGTFVFDTFKHEGKDEA
jgi:glutamine cyclotransferase